MIIPKSSSIVIRNANFQDCQLIARNVLSAVGILRPEEEQINSLAELCRREDTLYSWKNSFVALYDDKPAGTLTAYEGVAYRKMRKVTFPLMAKFSGHDFSDMVDETGLGEFYMDSIAVLEEYRHRGIASALLNHGIEQARICGASGATLAVDPENVSALRLYRRLGFTILGEIFIFNHTYWKMQYPLP